MSVSAIIIAIAGAARAMLLPAISHFRCARVLYPLYHRALQGEEGGDSILSRLPIQHPSDQDCPAKLINLAEIDLEIERKIVRRIQN